MPSPGRSDDLSRFSKSRVDSYIVAAGGPGAAALVKHEHGVERAASGVADLRTGRPMRTRLHYRAGSVTKPLVATVVLQLVAEGRLSLSDTVESWLPGILPYGDQVTVRQLLNHTSGARLPGAAPDAVRLQAGTVPRLDPPGAGRPGRRAAITVRPGYGAFPTPTTTTCWPVSSSRRLPAGRWAGS
jgi:CubicO group peptidase (beta-lactamase class C family)